MILKAIHLLATVDLPTPPLPDATRIVFATPGIHFFAIEKDAAFCESIVFF